MARSLLTKVVSSFWKRLTVVRVMSDVTASTSYQAAPPKPARFDPTQGSDSFGSLVDSNIPPEPRPSTPAQAAPQRPSDRAAPDRPAPRDTAPDKSASSNRTDPDGRAGPSDSPATAASNPSDTDADKASRSDGKADDGKTGDGKAVETKSSDKSAGDSASGDASATDAATVAQLGIPALTVQDPIAVVLPVTIAPADTPTVAQTPDRSPKPLAIAAAALATAAATATGSSASAGPETVATTVNTDTGPGVTPVTIGKSSAQPATISATAKPTTAVSVAVPVTEQPGVTDTTDVALTVASTGPQAIGGKTTSAKGTPQAQVKSPAASDGSTSPDPSKTAATTAVGLNVTGPQPADGAKSDAAPAAAGVAKPDVFSTTATTTDTISSRDPGSAGKDAAPSPANTDANPQGPATFQPQAPSAAPALSAANLTATAATGAPVPLSGLAVEIAASVRSGKTRFDVRLDPADLGRIDVRIDVDRNGQVTSHLRVEKPETLSMLQQDATQLRQALDDAGLKTGNGGLQFSLRDHSSSGQNNGNQSGANAQRLVVSEDETVPAAVAGRSYGRMLNSNGGVDIRV